MLDPSVSVTPFQIVAKNIEHKEVGVAHEIP